MNIEKRIESLEYALLNHKSILAEDRKSAKFFVLIEFIVLSPKQRELLIDEINKAKESFLILCSDNTSMQELIYELTQEIRREKGTTGLELFWNQFSRGIPLQWKEDFSA